jgi:hypothetical protein
VAFYDGLPSAYFGGLLAVLPKVRLGGFLLDFFKLGSQVREVKDTSGIPECVRRFFPFDDGYLLTWACSPCLVDQ